MRTHRLLAGIPALVAAVAFPAFAFQWWRDRGEWFPMEVGDRWTYGDASGGPEVVFDVVRRRSDRSFVVERRIGAETVGFVISVTSESVFILETSAGRFDPPFEEFRLPPAAGEGWAHEGRFAGRPLRVSSRRERLDRRRFRVHEESSISGATTFVLERGKGVVQLVGKASDLHGGAGFRVFDWRLKKFERRG